MSEYKHGSMDISGHEKTFEGFIKGAIWVACLAIGALLIMALFNS